MVNFLNTLYRRRKRYARHVVALLRYSTVSKLANLLRVEWEYRLKRDTVKGLPYVTIVDPVNVCNLKCPVCPTARNELLQPAGRIDPEKFKSLVDLVTPHTYRLVLYNWGEPFLHRQIISLISYAHERRVGTSISSNLNLLPREGAKALVLSGLDDLIVSCDGLSQETYERYRVGGQLDTVIANLRAIERARKKLGRSNPRIEFQFLVFRHNEHEVDKVEEFAKGHGADSVRLIKPVMDTSLPSLLPAQDSRFVRPEYQQLQFPTPPPRETPDSGSDPENAASQGAGPSVAGTLDAIPCYWPWRMMTVNWNGEVDPCCYNNRLGSFGNVFDQPLTRLFNNEKYVYARRRISGKASKQGFDDVICKTCDGYHF